MSLSMKHNVYGDLPTVEKEVEFTFSGDKYKVKQKKVEKEKQERLQPQSTNTSNIFKIYDSSENTQHNSAPKGKIEDKVEAHSKGDLSMQGRTKFGISNSIQGGTNISLSQQSGDGQSSAASFLGGTQRTQHSPVTVKDSSSTQQSASTHSNLFSKILNQSRNGSQPASQEQGTVIPPQSEHQAPPTQREVLNNILENIQSQQAQQGAPAQDPEIKLNETQQQDENLQNQTELQPEQEQEPVDPPMPEEVEEEATEELPPDPPTQEDVKEPTPISSEQAVENYLNDLGVVPPDPTQT